MISTDLEEAGDSLRMFKRVVVSLVRWLCSGCGSGYALKAPGTCGSIAALVFWWLLSDLEMLQGILPQLTLVLVVTAVGTIAVGVALREEREDDPQWIVIDEWAGLFVALLGVAPTQVGLALTAFMLFRVFDASKIGPVGWAEKLPRQYGIMADDLVAGALSALAVWTVRLGWAWF